MNRNFKKNNLSARTEAAKESMKQLKLVDNGSDIQWCLVEIYFSEATS